MSITGEPGRGPMRVGIPIADLCAGLFGAQAIFIALLERAKSGKGQWVQTSLLQAQIFMLDFQASRFLMDGDIPNKLATITHNPFPPGFLQQMMVQSILLSPGNKSGNVLPMPLASRNGKVMRDFRSMRHGRTIGKSSTLKLRPLQPPTAHFIGFQR